MFVAYFAQSVQSNSSGSQQLQMERFDEFGDPIDDYQMTPDERKIREKFNIAADVLPKIMNQLDPETILRLYALYKQATVGDADSSKRPSLLDIRGRTKFDAWKKLDKMDKFDSMREYTAIINRLAPNTENSKGNQGFGLKPSALSYNEEDIDLFDSSEKWFYAAKTGNLAELQRLLSRDATVLNSKDTALGMTALLWAADAGQIATVTFLLDHGADLNASDNDGNSSLHLAAICGHKDLYKFLIDSGVNCEALNNDGETGSDLLGDDASLA